MSLLALPPPLSPRVLLVANARMRGISYPMIGFALGFSYQAAEQFAKKYEKYHGRIDLPYVYARKTKRAGIVKTVYKCPECGMQSDWEKFRAKKRGFCSIECRGKNQRLLSDESVIWAIDARCSNAVTWTHISKTLKFPTQTIQFRIWRYLIARDQLTKANVGRIWAPASSLFIQNGRWKWLMDNTGHSPR